MNRRSSRYADSGSVLIETVIAAGIMAMILGTGFSAIASSLKRSRTLEDQQRAILVAQSQMALIDHVVSGNYGQRNGIDTDLAWQVTIEPYVNEAASASDLSLVQVTVDVFKGDSSKRLTQLRSLRIAGAR
jgi:type II secretory pathway pseudopilin PulG